MHAKFATKSTPAKGKNKTARKSSEAVGPDADPLDPLVARAVTRVVEALSEVPLDLRKEVLNRATSVVGDQLYERSARSILSRFSRISRTASSCESSE